MLRNPPFSEPAAGVSAPAGAVLRPPRFFALAACFSAFWRALTASFSAFARSAAALRMLFASDFAAARVPGAGAVASGPAGSGAPVFPALRRAVS